MTTGILLFGGCDAQDEGRGWEVQDVERNGDAARYSVEVDEQVVAASFLTDGDSALVRLEDANGETLFWGFTKDGNLDFWGAEHQAVEFADDDPYADFATQLLLDGDVATPNALRRGRAPAAGAVGPAKVAPSLDCIGECGQERTACEAENNSASGDDLLRPCGLEHSICTSDCKPHVDFIELYGW